MRKVPPSVMVREQIDEALFCEGLDANETNLLSTLAQLGLSYLLQQALEQSRRTSLAGATTSVGAKKLGADTATATKKPASLPPRGR